MSRNIEELQESLDRISMKDKDHLKKWLFASGRKYLAFNALHFVDALSMEELSLFQQLLIKYKNYRNTIPTGRMIEEISPIDGSKCMVEEVYSETLDILEFDEFSLMHLRNQYTKDK